MITRSCSPKACTRRKNASRADFIDVRPRREDVDHVLASGEKIRHRSYDRDRRLERSFFLVYPRFYSMESFQLPLGRRYQPGGIPLASHTGDSLEFMGTREYRPGDPIKHIHWRSWARVGKPVVMEFQEEFFSRIGIILVERSGRAALSRFGHQGRG